MKVPVWVLVLVAIFVIAAPSGGIFLGQELADDGEGEAVLALPLTCAWLTGLNEGVVTALRATDEAEGRPDLQAILDLMQQTVSIHEKACRPTIP